MYPSAFSTSSTRPRILEPGVATVPRRRCCALRMRVSMSPRGSFIDIAASSPARLDEARDQALRAELPERDPRHAELAVGGARATRDLAAVADAGASAVARQRGERQARLEALLHRPRLVVRDAQKLRALHLELLHQPPAAVVLLDRALLCHVLYVS